MDNEKNVDQENVDQEILTDSDVTAHTAAMWKYNPVPEAPEPYPESMCSAESSDIFEIIAASVRGKKHKHDGSNCDDSFSFAIDGNAVIAVVSDGAGSKAFSRIGAKCACEAVIKYVRTGFSAFKKEFPEYEKALGKPFDSQEFQQVCSGIAGILRYSYSEAYAAVEAAWEKRKELPEFIEAVGREPEIKDFSCTLLTTLTIPAETENGREFFTAAIQLGDGTIAAIDENAPAGSALALLGTADSGSFAGETEFITSEQMRSSDSLMARTKVRRGKMTSLLLMTDGVADDYYPGDPQLLRLVLDLKMNGIIPFAEKNEKGKNSPGEQAEIPAEKIPEPVAYPWVNDGDIKYALQYAKNVLSESGLTLEQLWERAEIQEKASLAAFGTVHEKNREEMLRVWLDNYVERGSFDDRTLLIVKAK